MQEETSSSLRSPKSFMVHGVQRSASSSVDNSLSKVPFTIAEWLE